MPRTIKAPFNFVPLQDRVYFPEWAGQVSQDIPFSDGVSGTIRLTITAETPIMVGGERREEADGFKHVYFCQAPDGRYYIPGSTIKGTLRSVLEILSYGKMTQVSNARFAVRDVNSRDYMDYLDPEYVRCGWMTLERGDYFIEDCGLPRRLDIHDIDRLLQTHLANNPLGSDDDKTAKWKYDQIGNRVGRLQVCYIEDRTLQTSRYDKRKFVRLVEQGGNEGTIVLTGQPNRRKRVEFVFPNKTNPRKLKVGKSVIDDFVNIHKDSADYRDFRKQQLIRGDRIPVFFVYDDEGKEIESVGLTYMFKIPSRKSVVDAIKSRTNDMLSKRMDLAECIFGKTDDDGSLKGRVHVGHAFLQGQPQFAPVVKPVLGQPHPSYFPLYLTEGLSWDEEGNVVISGRKRYPIRQSNRVLENPAPQGVDERRIASKLHPLRQGSVFVCQIHYHNLRPIELGALVSAINFDAHDNCRHNIGLAKPLGYGKVLMSIELSDELRQQAIEAFRNAMSDYWAGNMQPINELLAMAEGIPVERDNDFTYMKMSTNPRDNEFSQAKKDHECLRRFTEIIGRR